MASPLFAEWMRDAECAKRPGGEFEFYPDETTGAMEGGRGARLSAKVRRAKFICTVRCPVQKECLQYAMAYDPHPEGFAHPQEWTHFRVCADCLRSRFVDAAREAGIYGGTTAPERARALSAAISEGLEGQEAHDQAIVYLERELESQRGRIYGRSIKEAA